MDKNILMELIKDGKSTYGIADFMKCGQSTVRYWLRKYGLNTQNLPQSKEYKHSFNGRKCAQCNAVLTGSKKKFCSSTCKSKYHYFNTSDIANANTNQRQRKISRERKMILIEMKGGSCQHCGYNKNMAALSFHHKDPENKTFNIDVRKLSNTRWDSILTEAEKCDLLCLNCHAELHYPSMEMIMVVQKGFEPLTCPL